VVLGEDDVTGLVHAVLDAPVRADGLGEVIGVHWAKVRSVIA
jgi:hypothetical protein